VKPAKILLMAGAAIPAFVPVLHSYTAGSAATETVPVGAAFVMIEVWGAGGGGDAGSSSIGGNGGCGGGYARSFYPCTGGQTLTYTVGQGGVAGTGSSNAPGGNGGASAVSSGTLSITSMNGGGGGNSGGAGGTGAGSNQWSATGAVGAAGTAGPSLGGNGGTVLGGLYANASGAQGKGGKGGSTSTGNAGAAGMVSFYYTGPAPNGSSATLVFNNSNWKSSYENVASPYFQWIHGQNVGQLSPIRATLKAANPKFHRETSQDNFNNTWATGFDDGQTNFSTSLAANPGSASGGNGITISVGAPGATTITLSANGTTTTPALDAAWAVGDKICWEVDNSTPTAPIFKAYHWRVATGTASVTPVVNVTLTSHIPTAANGLWAFTGGGKGTGVLAASDAGTDNYGGQSWSMTPNTGFNFPYT
jgi:hypothetical protein